MYSNARINLINHFSNVPSLFTQLLLTELDKFQIKSLETSVSPTTEAIEGSNTYYINPNSTGAVIPTSNSMQSFKDMLENRIKYSYSSYEYLFKNVTKKILTLEKTYTFTQALVAIDQFRLKAGNHFYGAVLRSDDKLINPFHCLTPFTYAKHPQAFNGNYTVLLFFYSNRTYVENELGDTPNYREPKLKYLDTLINNIIKCSNHKVETTVPNNIESFFNVNPEYLGVMSSITTSPYTRLPNLSVLSAKEISKVEFEKIDHLSSTVADSGATEYLLVPHQIMVNGIFAPEYGVSLLRKTPSKLSGTFLTPSASCNIQSDSLRESLTWASVCTGRESQSTFAGISSLHCSNYASAYNSRAHSNASITLADISISKSVEIYQKLGILATPLSDIPSQDELNHLSDFMGYIDYMTKTFKLSLPDIENRYNTIKGQTNGKEEKQDENQPTTKPESNDSTIDESN